MSTCTTCQENLCIVKECTSRQIIENGKFATYCSYHAKINKKECPICFRQTHLYTYNELCECENIVCIYCVNKCIRHNKCPYCRGPVRYDNLYTITDYFGF